MSYPFPAMYPVERHPALAPFIDNLTPMIDSYKAALSAYERLKTLYDHAVARGCSHPGVDKFRRMHSEKPSAPHGTRTAAAIGEMEVLDVKDDEKILEWKRKFEPLVAKMSICEQKLRELLDEADIKAFAIAEEAQMIEESLWEQKFQDWDGCVEE